MPKSSKSTPRKSGGRPAPKKAAPARKLKASPEYMEYLERYEEFGEGRRRLSAQEFDKLDDELLELLDLSAEGRELSDDQVIRIQELEFLLIDSE